MFFTEAGSGALVRVCGPALANRFTLPGERPCQHGRSFFMIPHLHRGDASPIIRTRGRSVCRLGRVDGGHQNRLWVGDGGRTRAR